MLLYQRIRPRTLDLYIIREIVPPTLLGLLVFTFVLLLDAIPNLLKVLVARGADLLTVGRIFLNMLPSIFAVTIPMAFLLGVLLAFGRLASESELIAMRAGGVSPVRLLAPLLILSALTTGATFYINAVALPEANQAYREHVFALMVSKAKDVRPRVFTEDLVPRMVVYISDIPAETAEWKDVLIQDMRDPARPSLILSRAGRLVIDKERKEVQLGFEDGVRHFLNPAQSELYEQEAFSWMKVPLPFDEFFPKLPLAKGDREMRLSELAAQAEKLKAEGKPAKEYQRFEVEWHKKFAISAACLVFGLLGLGLSLGSRKEARSGAFGLSIVVIFVYYVLIRMGEQAGDTGLMPAFLAMWGANLVLGTIAIVLIALNQSAAAFDPLDARHYLAFLPAVRRRAAAAAPARAAARPLDRPNRRPRAVVVVRVPRVSLRFPTLIDRYVGRSYLGLFLLVLAAFSSIYALAEFMDLFDDVQQNRVKGKVVVHFYAYHLPWIVHFLAPLAVLVGVLATYGILSRRNEVTAMKAGGVSLYRASVPVIAIAALFSSTLYGMQELLLPYTNRIAAMDFNVIKGRPPQSSGLLDRRWILGSDARFYNYDYLSEKKRAVGLAEGRERMEFSLFSLRVYDVDPGSWRLRDVLYAARASWNGQGYDLERGWRRGLDPRPAFRAFSAARTRELEPPSYFTREERPSDSMSFPELKSHIEGLEKLGFDTLKLQVQLHKKLAFPMAAVVMVLLGIPFSFVVGRRGALYGVAIALVIAILYWAVMETFQALGENAILPPFLAAWAPNLLFAATGLYLLLNLET
jgi:LPS export ABC transporter permease LptG/LPS export ABC transporter permease LptF